MVLEGLLNPSKATGKPWEMFFIGFLYSLVGIALGYWVFRAYVSLVMVTFTTIAAIPFIYSAVQSEEEKSGFLKSFALIKEHSKLVSVFIFLFLGFVTAFVLAFVFLPEAVVGEIFQSQIQAIAAVNGTPTGNFAGVWTYFSAVVFSNLRVLFFCLVFSLLYGAGAIYILSWNASVMGTAIGDAIRVGLLKNAGAFSTVSSSLLGYLIHGLPEMAAFFTGGLAGGIASMAMLREGFKSEAFAKAGKDALNLTGFALIMLLLAALIETYISPTLL